MKNVFLRFYDQTNLGDDLFVEIIADRYADRFTVVRPRSAGGYRPPDNVDCRRNSLVVAVVDRLLENLVGIRSLVSLLQARKSDLMVYIGGSLFMQTGGLRRWRREDRFFALLGRPFYILGSNVGPVLNEKFITILAKTFGRARDVCFRDQASYAMFDQLGSTRVSTDVAFTLDTEKYSTAREGDSVVFSIVDVERKCDGVPRDVYEGQVADLVEKFSAKGFSVSLMSFCRAEGDEDAARRIAGRLDPSLSRDVELYFYNGDLTAALEKISSSKVIVASRFHATVLGLLFGKKVFPMYYSDKMRNVMDDIGFRGPSVDMRRMSSFDWSEFDPEELEFNDVGRQRVCAQEQFAELDRVLTRRDR
ncbi:hypothetical protein CVAR_0317 [Corynebacterium variabile DSM 44702]|uniref:Polysaccharide pyruvyl transferase domain-containing protein n=1 Tax=Corynebacterium variabile (strain DSM 44702 / CIP 107183 / JCM 12073 / NCIMB 30131) TaxID=858619 RepID=G0H9W1_CORVD|nr:polysaccharide pyruvyl transferase family protein [Corynebacterium variabile]AEK35665.1 hypothetical protein CVAR_0317 [Corynebacterium variabile DSM 44702]